MPRSVHVGFMVDKPARGQAALPVLPFPPLLTSRTYTAEIRAHPQVGSRGIYGVQTGIGTGCSPSTSFPPVTIIPNTHLTDYDRRHIHLATDSQIT